MSKSTRRGRNRRRDIKVIVLVLVAISAYQYATTGTISWHQQILAPFTEYADRPEAGWRKATDAFNEAVPEKSKAEDYALSGRVVRVADGDTVSILDAQQKQHKIRLFGIDAPERDQAHGSIASRTLADMIDGEVVGVEQRDIDDYGRIVGVIHFQGQNINVAMVAGGHAWWYRRHARSEAALASAEATAKAEGRGLWSATEPTPPWEWRRQNR